VWKVNLQLDRTVLATGVNSRWETKTVDLHHQIVFYKVDV